MDTTQIQIKKKTREELQKLRLTKRESYEEIIKRLICKFKKKVIDGQTKTRGKNKLILHKLGF